jgi:hypothetical protein
MNGTFSVLLLPVDKDTPHNAAIQLKNRSGKYRLGAPNRPSIHHDNGHLGKYPKRPATMAERTQLLKWIAKLEIAESACNDHLNKYVKECKNENISDATAAYRHFLFGEGKDRKIDYERYVQNDLSGAELIKNLINDFRIHAETIGKDRNEFSVTSDVFTVGKNGIGSYPKTVNWQKTLGAHFLWVSADVTASADKDANIWYTANVTIHMEDRYNFNPGANDIATGTPDSENGLFEITELAQQYMNFGTLLRTLRWREGSQPSLVDLSRTPAKNSASSEKQSTRKNK